MRHSPFLEALAAVAGTSDPVWHDVAMGYLVLRFFDEWLEEGLAPMVENPGLAELQSRMHGESGLRPPVRDLLLTVVQGIHEASRVDPTLVSEPLLAYGMHLQSAGRLILAAHVYGTVIAVLDSPRYGSDPLAAVSAYMRYGYVMRFLGQFDTAHNAYQRSEVLAQQAGVTVLTLRARVGLANTLRDRGNLGEAEILLDQILVDAIRAELVSAQSWALHSRGSVRHLRGRPREALQDFFRAYKLIDRDKREVLLGDIAASAADAGFQTIARNAHRVLAYTANIPRVRSAALGNLLELAVLDEDETEFERILTHIELHAQRHPVPVEHVMHIQLYTAYGIQRFGNSREAAIEAYRTVMTQAHDAGIHQVAFKAEQSLRALTPNG